jgi:hypothetical protein
MAYTRYSIRVSGVERMVLDIDRSRPESPVIADDTLTTLQIGGMSTWEAAQAANDWYANDGAAVWGEDEDIEVVELGQFCELCAAGGVITIAMRIACGKRVCDVCLGPMTTDAYAEALKGIDRATTTDELEEVVAAYLEAIGEPEERASSESYGETATRLEASSDASEVLKAAENKWWELESPN